MDTRINKVGRRDLEKEVSVPKKKMKMDESLLQENKSDTAGCSGRRLKNSYRKYIFRCHGRRKKNTAVIKKTNEEVVSEDITDKTDDIVVRRLSYGSNAFNNSHTTLLNNYGEGDEVSKPANDGEEKLVVCNGNKEVSDRVEVVDEYLDDGFELEFDVYDYEKDDNEDNQINIETLRKEEEMKRINELTRIEKGVKKKLKDFELKSLTQARIEERNMDKDLNISAVLKSEFGRRESVKKFKEVIHEKEIFRFVGVPSAYSKEGEVLAFMSGITRDEADYIDDVVKEKEDVMSKILNIFGFRLENTESFGKKTIETGETMIKEYREEIEFYNKKWKRLFEGKAIFVRNKEEKTVKFFSKEDEDFYYKNINEYKKELLHTRMLVEKMNFWQENLKVIEKLNEVLNELYKSLGRTVKAEPLKKPSVSVFKTRKYCPKKSEKSNREIENIKNEAAKEAFEREENQRCIDSAEEKPNNYIEDKCNDDTEEKANDDTEDKSNDDTEDLVSKDLPKGKWAKRKARAKAKDLDNKCSRREIYQKEVLLECSMGDCIKSEEIRSNNRRVQVLSRTDGEKEVSFASYEKDKWRMNSVDYKDDHKPKNIKNLAVNVEFVGGDHIDAEKVGKEIPDNFRKCPIVKVEKQKIAFFLCTHCKCISYSAFAASLLECHVHNWVRHDIDTSRSSPESIIETVTTVFNMYVNVNDVRVRRKFGAINTKNPKDGLKFREGDEITFAYLVKNFTLSKEFKNVFTFDAMMKQTPRKYKEFLDSLKKGDMKEIHSKWLEGGVFKHLVESCISLRIASTSTMEGEEPKEVKDKKDENVLKSFLVEFTAPRIFNEVVRDIIEKKLLDGVSRAKNFRHIELVEKKNLVVDRGLIADESVEYYEGLNLDVLRRTFQQELRRVVKVEEEIGFEMRNTGSARKLITKLQKFRFLDEKLKEKPDKKRVVYSGLQKCKGIGEDKRTVKILLEELKRDLESTKSRCVDSDIKSKMEVVIGDVCAGIEYFANIEHSGMKQRKLNTLRYLSMIFICFGVFLVEK